MRRAAGRLSLLIAGYVGVVLFFGTRIYLEHVYYGEKAIPLSRAVMHAAIDWAAWLVLGPLVWWLARRTVFDRRRWALAAVAHLIACPVVVAAAVAAKIGLVLSLGIDVDLSTAQAEFHGAFMTYWVIVLGVVVLRTREELRDRELRSSRLRATLDKARLHALQAQLRPHFLFNALNSVVSLIHEDPEGAEHMVARLGVLLRSSLDHDLESSVPLAREIEFVRTYLEIQCVRYGDRLAATFDVAPELLDLRVPFLILQPIVENAVEHGCRRGSGEAVHVAAECVGARLRLTVTDDGKSVSSTDEESKDGEGIGLKNVRSRLQIACGPDSRVDSGPLEGGGWRVVLEFPARRASGDPSS